MSLAGVTPSFHRARNEAVKFCVTCTCTEFKKTHNCVHIKSVLCDQQNCMRIKSFGHFTIKPIPNLSSNTQWIFVIIPESGKEEIQMRIVFQRRILSSVFRSSAAVLIYSPRKVFRNRSTIVYNVSYARELPKTEDLTFMKTN